MNVFIKRLAVVGFALGLSLASFGNRSILGFSRAVFAQETDDQLKIDMYKKFVDNRVPSPKAAYQAAKDYLQKYSKDNDQYTQYLQKWVQAYDREDRKFRLPNLIYNDKNFVEAYKLGQQVLADDPENLRTQIDLGYAGYLAATNKNESFNTEALGYARKAIGALEAGKAPTDWAPFKGKEDTLAYLNYTVGFLTLKATPEQALDSLLKAAQLESDLKKAASTYYLIALAYESGPYKTMSAAYQTAYANKPETPESKAALDRLNVVIDRIIDAYARAIAASGTDPKTEQTRKEWLARVTDLYKFRHQGADTGLTDLIASALVKPLPPKP
ncbi:MAG: hypothetical protein ABR555_12265 [Pyrinomonadaceae bacterium]